MGLLDHDDKINLGMVDHKRKLCKARVGIERNVACADGINRELMEEMLWPVFNQKSDPMSDPIASGTVRIGKFAYPCTSFSVADFGARGAVGASGVGGYCKERVICLEPHGLEEGVWNGLELFDVDHF